MFTATGAPPERVVSGLTATTLISTAVLFSLPVLSLPAILFGGATVAHTAAARPRLRDDRLRPDPRGAARSRLFTDDPLRAAGTARRSGRATGCCGAASRSTDLPDRLIDERDLIKSMLGRRWWEALPYAAGNWLLDYSALLAALAATGARPRASLVLIAYVVAALLGMVPITPGRARLRRGRPGRDARPGRRRRGRGDPGHARLPPRLVLDADPGRRRGLRALPAALRREGPPPDRPTGRRRRERAERPS